MSEKMTFKLTVEEVKIIRNALSRAADTCKTGDKEKEFEDLWYYFTRRLTDHENGK